MVKCKQCGFKNPVESNFCGNCGFKLSEKVFVKISAFNTLSYLHMIGGAYLILSIILIWRTSAMSLFLFVGGFLNLYIAWKFYTNRIPRMAWVISLSAITMGLFYTILSYIFIPDWIIFIVTTIAFWQSMQALKEASIKK